MIDRLPIRLLARGIRFRCLKTLGLPGKPEALSLEVTTRCIARCVMCNIWRLPTDAPELVATEWLKLLDAPLFAELKELDVTGGEPFLRDDLVELLLGIGQLKTTRLKKLCSVAITTNGFLTDKVLKDVAAVIAPLEAAGVTLVFACGFDAVGAVHDAMRRVQGGWDRLDATIRGLTALRDRFPSLVLGLKTTVTRHNIDGLDEVCRYADAHGLFTIVSPYILTANRYANLERQDDLSLSPDDLAKLRDFYASPRFRWSYYRDELLQFLATGRMAKPCSAGFNYFFIRSNGELFSCPIIAKPLGNVRETPPEELIRSKAATRFRRGIMAFLECAACTEPGLERYALPFEGFHYLRQYLRLGREGFAELHRHMGLDKYLG